MAENLNFDFSDLIENADTVREITTPKEKPKKKQFLEFEISEDDSPLKVAIIERINEKQITLADVCAYCVKACGGDKKKGQALGYNVVNCLRVSNSMNDSKFSMWCDLLNLDILLVDRKAPDTDDENDN